MSNSLFTTMPKGIRTEPLLETGRKLSNLPIIPNPNEPEAQQGAQKPDKFDAFHAYASEQMADAGFRKSGSDKKAGWVAQSGRFKGLTQDEIQGKLRQEFAGFDEGRRARYQGMAQGEDIAVGAEQKDVVQRPNLLANEEAGANRLLTEAGNTLSDQNRTNELGNLDLGVKTGSVSGTPEPKLVDVDRPKFGPNFMSEMETTGRAVLGGQKDPGNLPQGMISSPDDPKRIDRRDIDIGTTALRNNKPILKKQLPGNLG
tara:strand:+ start:3888 stop:4661 length:774 start_codon:yes stop_codon:yes gene_type:complete